MKLNIITPCSKPEHLPLLFKSILTAKTDTDATVCWYVVFDGAKLKPDDLELPSEVSEELSIGPAHGIEVIYGFHGDQCSVSGNAQYNWALDQIEEGFVTHLAEDNLLHPLIIKTLCREAEKNPHFGGLIVAQELEDGAKRAIKIIVGNIDTAQFFVDRTLLGKERLRVRYPTADGMLIEKISEKNIKNFVMIDEPLSFYKKVNEYFLLRDAPKTLQPGIIVTVNEDYFVKHIKSSLNPTLRGTITHLGHLRNTKVKVNTITENVINVVPLRGSNPYYRQGKGVNLIFETRRDMENCLNIVEWDLFNEIQTKSLEE